MGADPDGQEGAGGGIEPAECGRVFGLVLLRTMQQKSEHMPSRAETR
mgnify:CR=1 FL=1